MRKLTESETFWASIFISLILVLSLEYMIVVHGWLGGATIGETDPFDLLVQIVIAMVLIFLPSYLVSKYAMEKNFMCLK